MTNSLSLRQAGVLMHPTSLPNRTGKGQFNDAAYHFIDFMDKAGLRVWQVLPFGPTGPDGSPYQSSSCFALNAAFLDLSRLESSVGESDRLAVLNGTKLADLAHAKTLFEQAASPSDQETFAAFKQENAFWLEDYACYQTIKAAQNGQAWFHWPDALKHRHKEALNAFIQNHANDIECIRFQQFLLHQDWLRIKAKANEKGIATFGDLPIFISHDSSDVWANPELFTLNADGHCDVVAGVPPDYFSETGQRWGNPHYHWERMEADDFLWWKQRLARQLTLFDWVRIDHFRGFEAYWIIPEHEPTAINGFWQKGPGNKLFDALEKHFGELPVVAEDLGIITDEVTQLRNDYQLPGMKILQFAFGGDASNPYLPHNHEINSVVYTGTHDNDTTTGWYDQLDEPTREHCMAYLGLEEGDMPWDLIRSAFASVAQTAIIPMQDFLSRGSNERMNTPGTTEGNWQWQCKPEDLNPALAEKILALSERYGRLHNQSI